MGRVSPFCSHTAIDRHGVVPALISGKIIIAGTIRVEADVLRVASEVLSEESNIF